MSIRLCAVLGLAFLASHAAEAQQAARDIVRQRTSPQGEATPELRAQTGWQTLRGYAFQVQLKQPDGSFAPANGKLSFATGQSFRLLVESHNDLWFYILNRGPTGNQTLLLPDRGEMHLLIKRGERATVPPDGCFTFSAPPGTEVFRIVAAPDRLEWANPEALFKLENGVELAQNEAREARQQKEIRTKSLDRIEQRQAKMTQVEAPLGKVVSDLASSPQRRRGVKDTMVVPPEPEGEALGGASDNAPAPPREVVHASPTAGNRDPFVYEVKLEHKRN